MRRIAALCLLALAVPVAVASAADPSSGKLSSASPVVSWKGQLVHPYPYHLAFNEESIAGQSGKAPCDPPGCDTFTLDVTESADLNVTVESEQTRDMSLRIRKPDGSWQYVDGWSDAAKPTVFKLKKAPTGTYTINIVARIFGSGNPTAVTDTADYSGTATLGAAKPAAAPSPAATATPTPGTSPQPAGKSKSTAGACTAKAKRIRNAKRRRAALKRCRKRA